MIPVLLQNAFGSCTAISTMCFRPTRSTWSTHSHLARQPIRCVYHISA
uniref:Uncharacterized protein n=1 Tax=Anguilla anguilla TaxID=7936 RepID=A0A0E9TDF9_ANGAN